MISLKGGMNRSKTGCMEEFRVLQSWLQIFGGNSCGYSRYARKASGEENTQQCLAVRAFIKAIPKKIGNRLREKKIPTLKKALEEAKFLQTLHEEQ